MTRIAFIAGLEHSGTTLLDFIVGGGTESVALGEVSSFIDSESRAIFLSRFGRFEDAHLCSCGKRHETCDMWAPVVDYMSENPSSDLVARYGEVIDSAVRNFGHEVVLSDSSKSVRALKTALEAAKGRPDTDIRVLFAIKDVRSFVASITQTRQLGFRGQILCFRWWQGGNQEIFSFLESTGVPYLVVFYEALCLRTRPTVDRICQFLGIRPDSYFDTLNAKLAHQRSHICMGNTDMAFRNRDEIRYDCRWFNHPSVNFLYCCELKARRINARLLTEHLQV